MNKHKFPYNWNLKDAVFTKDKGKYRYMLGMSVPPVMTAQIASNIYEQWLSNLD